MTFTTLNRPAVAMIVGELILKLVALLFNRLGVAVVGHVSWRLHSRIVVFIDINEILNLAVGNIVDFRNGDARPSNRNWSFPLPVKAFPVNGSE